MDQDSEILKINIYGTGYPIKSGSDTDADYIRRVAEYVDKKMREIDNNIHSKSSLKVAILAALNITDELFQERAQKDALFEKMASKIERLSASIDEGLAEESE